MFRAHTTLTMINYERNFTAMSVKNSNKTMVRTLPIPVAIAAIILLLAFVGWWGYAALGTHAPAEEHKPLRPEYQADNDWILQKAKETQGDASRLSDEDQKQLAAKTHGMGAMVLKNAYAQSQH